MENLDESILTAYALGELTGSERAAVAALLVGNESARRYVGQVRATAALLSDELARESYGGLTDLQHAALESRLADMLRLPGARSRRTSRHDRWALVGSIAASVLIVGGTIVMLAPLIYNRAHRAAEDAYRRSVDPSTPHGVVDPAPSTNSSLLEARRPTGPELEEAPVQTVMPAPVDEAPLPQPDDLLAASGSDREEAATLPAPLVAPRPEPVKPVSPVRVTRGVPQGPTADQVAVRPADSPRVDRTNELSLPTNQYAPGHDVPGHGDGYAPLLENPFVDVASDPASGFSAGVDTASYSNVRRYLTHGKLPPKDAVRIEEMINYFPVHSGPSDTPLSLQVEIGACPWRPERRLARVCVLARDLLPVARPPVNLVFVVDNSASMRSEKAKLPLLKQALRLLIGKLSARDRIAIIAYGHEAGVVLPSTAVEDKQAVWAALDRIEAGGRVAGGQGIELAYDVAESAFIRGGVNRIVLATDGNWNVGLTSQSHLLDVVRTKAGTGISLTVLGVGMTNLKDGMLQNLALAGVGSYAYIDTLAEAKKVLVDQVNGSLVSIARDVKVQVSFNAASAGSYRLIGYERRLLSADDVHSRSRIGGELGAGQSVTALYEVIPTGKTSATHPGQMLSATVTYADPASAAPHVLTARGDDHASPLPRMSREFRFSAAVAEFGLLLRDSDYKGNATYASVLDHAEQAAAPPDQPAYRQELLNLIHQARALSGT